MDFVLQSQKLHSVVTDTYLPSFEAVLPEQGAYQVLIKYMNALKFGSYEGTAKVFTFGNDRMSVEALELPYLLQLRLFNDDKEILVQREDGRYHVRVIQDEKGDDIEAVDSYSPFLGDIKRKLQTRAYITYDPETGQAGYGHYRYVSVTPEREDTDGISE